MSRLNTLNPSADFIVGTDKIRLHTIVIGKTNASTGKLEVYPFLKKDQNYAILGVIDSVETVAGTDNEPNYAKKGDKVRVSWFGVEGTKIRAITDFPDFNSDGAYFFAIERSSTGTEDAYEDGVTGAIIQSKKGTLASAYVGVRIMADFQYIRANVDGTVTYRFDLPKRLI